MFTNNKLAKSVRLAIAFGAAATALPASQAFAADEEIEKIEVTGSAIKRTDMEGALPVTVIDAAEIARSGVTSVPDLIQALPSMQGFTTAGDSVGGSGGGIQTASLRNLGSSYTLVLLNGRRMAPATSGGTVDLSGIPLAAVERVEVLTDGASALYGSDAIAGVLNFILKTEVDKTTVSARVSSPEEKGGGETNLSLTTGFGDIDEDGFSIVASLAYDDKDRIASVDRDFSKSGIIPFTYQGTDYTFFNGSPNAIPANVWVDYYTGDVNRDEDGNPILDADGNTSDEIDTVSFNPWRESNNGACPNFTAPVGTVCRVDYTSLLEILPESERTSAFLNGTLRLTDDLEAYSTFTYSNFQMTARIAPYPTGGFPIALDSDLYTQNVLPHLTDEQIAGMTHEDAGVTAAWRAVPAGNRTTEYDTDTIQFVAGIRGVIAEDIDFDLAVTHSSNDSDQNYPTGWLLREKYVEIIGGGAVPVFDSLDEIDMAAAQQAIAPAIYSGPWNTTETSLLSIDGKASMPLMELPAGEVYMAAGFDYRDFSYKNTIADANRNQELLFLGAGTDYDLERTNFGAFAEFVVPVLDDLEVTGAIRYDNISAVKDVLNNVDANEDEDATTYKLSAMYNVHEDLSLRASYGTGFKAPSLIQIARPQVPFGVTSGNYLCPFGSTDPLAKYCLSGERQYGVFRQGNSQIQSEKSTQFTYGFVYAPTQDFSVTIDYWNIEIEDLVQGLTEAQVFGDPELYRHLFTSRKNLTTGKDELAIILGDGNVGLSKNSGVDWNITFGTDVGFGRYDFSVAGTHMIESEYSRPGTNPSEGDFVSSLGRFGDDNAIAFDDIIKVDNTFTHGDFTHTLTFNWRSGYDDQVQPAGTSVVVGDATGPRADIDIQLEIDAYVKTDYQLNWSVSDDLNATFGINNLLDEEPPLTLRRAGAGHQLGFDPRYYDAYGRTLYVSAEYKF